MIVYLLERQSDKPKRLSYRDIMLLVQANQEGLSPLTTPFDPTDPSGKLNRIQLSGFKSIEKLDLTLNSLNVLIGANGAGKSNFIQFFTFMRHLANRGLSFYVAQQGGADNLLRFGQKVTDRIEVHLEFLPNVYHCILEPDVDDNLIFQQESYAIQWDMGPKSGVKTLSGAKPGSQETRLPPPHHNSVDGWVAWYLEQWQVFHFHDTSDSAKVKKTAELMDGNRLLSDAGNLAAFLYEIQDTDEYLAIIETVQRVAPYFKRFVLEPELRNPNSIRLKWLHQGYDKVFSASQLSDGTLRFICLATLLLQPKWSLPKTLIIDEPELGLHPHALELLGGMISACSARTQMIMATQSVTLLNQFHWQDLIIVDRDQQHQASTFRRPTEDDARQWVLEYGMGDLWANNWIGGTPGWRG